MDYIDWIISSFIFLITVSLILVAVSSIIPINPNDDSLSKSIFVSTVENIPVYNFYVNNTETEVIPFSFTLENLDGVSQNLFAIDGNNYFGVIQNDNRFFNYTITSPEEPKGIQVLKESFNDFDYSDNFAIVPDANINAGILVLENPSTITSNNSYYDYLGFLSTTNSLTAYVSYTDVNNNYFCRFSDSTITIGKTEESTQTILKTTSYSKTTDWHRVYFGYTKDNLINCNAGDTETSYQDSNTISKTQVVISTIYDNTLIDDIYIYLNNDLDSNSSGTIIGNYIDANITTNLITIKTMDNALSSTLDFNFSGNLEITDGNGISFVKNSEEENKLLFFPQTKEFWSYKGSEETLEINLDNNTGLDLDIPEIEDLALWLDASSLTLSDNDLVSEWTDLSGNDYHATQSSDGNKPTFKENILNGKPIIRFNGQSFLQTNEFLSTLEQPNTSFIIFTADENPGYIILDGITDGNRNTFGSSGPETITVSLFAGTVLNSSQLLPQDWSVWAGLYDNTNSQILKNGIIENQGSVGLQNLTGLTIGCRFSLTRFLIGDIAEILIYDSALSDSNRLLVENYLSQKYAIDVENGLSFTDNSMELINLNDNNKIMKFEFFDKETNKPVDCNYEYKNKKITISGCETDVVIKTRFRLNGIATFPEYPNISITKTKEQMITKEKLDSLSNQTFYLSLENKVNYLANIRDRPVDDIYKNYTNYLTEYGFVEPVQAKIKSYVLLSYEDIIANISSPNNSSQHTSSQIISFASTISGGSGNYSCSWDSNVSGTLSSNCNFSTSTLEVGDHNISLTVQDTKRSNLFDSDSIIVIIKEHLVLNIDSPGNSSKHDVYQNINFLGNITNTVGDYSCSWDSNIDGLIGSACDINVNDLSVGVHLITLSVTDELGSGSTSIIIEVVCNPVPIGGKIEFLEHISYIDTNATTRSGTYVLQKDLNFLDDNSYYCGSNKIIWTTGAGWFPIGNSTASFNGNFDGNSFAIKNLYINRTTTDHVGLFGYTGTGTINNLDLEDVNVRGNTYVGSLAGYNNSRIENVSSSGVVYGASRDIGGLVGRNYASGARTIKNSTFSGTVSSASICVGGIVGWNYGTVETSYSKANISGTSYLGGLIGENYSTAVISNSYATGSVSGSNRVGGFTGVNNGTILNSYSKGAVAGSSDTGGFVGIAAGTSTNSYWDINTSGRTTSAGGTGKTTAEMKTQSTFTGWDFSTVWNISEATYPYLRNNLESLIPSITTPLINSTYIVNENINFIGTAINPQGNYTCSWSSNIDGSLGSGCDVNVSDLTVGTHLITLSTTDEIETKTTTINITIKINAYTVMFKDYNGTILDTQEVNPGEDATPPANPTRTGYTFTGWDVSYTNISADTNVTAQYTINTYTVTFNKNGGDTEADPQTKDANYNSNVGTLPAHPTKIDYTFTSWNTLANGSGTTFNASTTVTANITVYAQYTIFEMPPSCGDGVCDPETGENWENCETDCN